MKDARAVIRVIVSTAIIASMLPQFFVTTAQDLVAADSITGGSSAFVFRGSRKNPQSHLSAGNAFLGGNDSRMAAAGRSNASIAAAAKRRRAAAAAARKKAIAAAANRKIALSNTLTAKGEGYLDSDKYDLAIAAFRDALVQNPKNDRATGGLSEALTGKGIEVAGDRNNEAAAVYFNEAVKLDKENAVAYAQLAAIYGAKGDNDKAIPNYEKAIALDTDMVGLNAPLGLAYIDKGDIAKAEACLQKANAGHVDTVDSRYLQALIYFKQNKNAEALAAFDRVLQLDGKNVLANYYRGQVYDRMNQPNDTIAAYKRTLEIAPGFGPASYDLGVAYYNAGDYNNAAAAYRQAIQADNGNSQAHANLASTYRQLERYPDANAEYKIASENIKTADLYSEWGYCLGKTNEWDKSVDRLGTAHTLEPTAIDASNVGWAYYNAGQAYKAEKKDNEAKASYELGKAALQEAVQKDPKLDAAYLNLGSTYNGLGDFQAAVNALNIAINLRRDWVIAINQLGVGYRGLNDLVNAVSAFKRVTDLDGNYAYGLFNLGEAYNASGNKKEAKKVNDRLRKLDPAMATRLENVLSGKAIIDAGKQKIENKIPKIPKFPY